MSTLSIPPNTFSAPPNTITFHAANKEVLRITHDGRLVTGEGLSAEEATQQAAKLLIASFEAEIKKMVEKRIAAELDQLRADNLTAHQMACAAGLERDQLRAELAVAENWVLHHQQHAEDLIGENVRLRADLERFTGHGLLDCHAICDQRDAAVAERDRLRAELADEKNLHTQTRTVVEELNTICTDLRNAGGPPFIRSEAIRLLREDQVTLRAEVERLKKQIREDNLGYACEL